MVVIQPGGITSIDDYQIPRFILIQDEMQSYYSVTRLTIFIASQIGHAINVGGICQSFRFPSESQTLALCG